MGTGFTAYIGYMVAMNIGQNDDLESCLDFLKEHEEYNLYDCNERVSLIVGKRCAKLVFVDDLIRGGYAEWEDYFPLRGEPAIPDDVYDALNKAYKLLCYEDLDKALIQYAAWFQFS